MNEIESKKTYQQVVNIALKESNDYIQRYYMQKKDESSEDSSDISIMRSMRRAIGALIEKLDREKQPDGWISVEDRLPETETTVLILQHYTEGASYASITMGHLHQSGDFRRKPYWYWIAYGADMVHPKIEDFHRSTFICPGSEFVTHWMPLPEPPKEDLDG